ncbi:MAG: hypothetical protein ABJN34_07730 [Litoreibacter sp.]|uniref:hypothetical protein n=1 Tax=Litoreibacter sp. TaxID=1969459 RepID=UPI003297DB36
MESKTALHRQPFLIWAHLHPRSYWFQLRNIRPEGEALSQMMTEDVQHAFEEGRAVLNAVQKGMANKTTPHIDLPIDGRQLQAMINEEQQVDQQMAK